MKKDLYGTRIYKVNNKVFFIHENASGIKYSISTRLDKFNDICKVATRGTLQACKDFCKEFKED